MGRGGQARQGLAPTALSLAIAAYIGLVVLAEFVRQGSQSPVFVPGMLLMVAIVGVASRRKGEAKGKIG